jgi:hypothetical protein
MALVKPLQYALSRMFATRMFQKSLNMADFSSGDARGFMCYNKNGGFYLL